MAQVAELPNKLFSGGRSVLARFGYRHLTGDSLADDNQDWAGMWELLKGDFTLHAQSGAPSFADMDADEAKAARDYMRRRLEADHYLEVCEQMHVELFSGGIDRMRVERYAIARDAYEDCVNGFGAERERLEALLQRRA